MALVSGAPPALDCLRAISSYINKILRPRDKAREISGMKCLLLDKETKTMLSMVIGMNEILAKDVYLVEMLDKAHVGMKHMKAICLLRPTEENVRVLKAHLGAPEFLEYHLFFTNVVPGDALRRLADADKLGVVQQVQEYYADYYAMNPDVFSLSLTSSLSLSRPRSAYSSHEEAALKRAQQGLLALLLSLKVRPLIRYQASSEAASKLALELTGTISGERELFTFSKTGSQTLLLVLDRREDPLTPLLTQWTYQAMVHELMPKGIQNNVVNMKGVAGISKDIEEIVLSPTSDEFFRKNMFANYGDIGEAVRRMLDEYSSSHRIHENINSIADMARFVEKYPELKSKGLAVSKHVALMSHIASTVETRRLLELSEIEQSMTVADDSATHFKAITDLLSSTPAVDPFDALRLLMIFCLRYEKSAAGRCSELRRFVAECGVGAKHLDLLDTLLSYGGAAARSGDLYGTAASGNVLSRFTSAFRSGLSDATNVYTQHSPYMLTLLGELARGKLKTGLFPYTSADPGPGARFGNVIVFIVGGITYEESAKVAGINAGTVPLPGGGGAAAAGGAGAGAAGAAPFRVLLGGTSVLSSGSFIAELMSMREGAAHSAVDVGPTYNGFQG